MLVTKISFCSNFNKNSGKNSKNISDEKCQPEKLSCSSQSGDEFLNNNILINLSKYKQQNAISSDYFDILYKRLMKDPTKISVEFLSDILNELISQDVVDKYHLYDHVFGTIISDIEKFKLKDGTHIDKRLYDMVSSGAFETSAWHCSGASSCMQVTNGSYNLFFGEIEGKNVLNISPFKSNLIYSVTFTPLGQFDTLVISNQDKILKRINSDNTTIPADTKLQAEQYIFPELLFEY